ncbi:MAG: hypothetical protein ACREQ5_09360 [Candidatus Dormibacteria bacterium]
MASLKLEADACLELATKDDLEANFKHLMDYLGNPTILRRKLFGASQQGVGFIDLGGPASGKAWQVRSLVVVANSSPFTAVTSVFAAVFMGPTPGTLVAGAFQMEDCVYASIDLSQSVTSVSLQHPAILQGTDHLYVRLGGVNVGNFNYQASALGVEVPDRPECLAWL